jgi:hypothetical protein
MSSPGPYYAFRNETKLPLHRQSLNRHGTEVAIDATGVVAKTLKLNLQRLHGYPTITLLHYFASFCTAVT